MYNQTEFGYNEGEGEGEVTTAVFVPAALMPGTLIAFFSLVPSHPNQCVTT
jgi:hypothetical protein